MDRTDLTGYVILRCVVGSRAFGLAEDESDTDRRGIFLPPAELHWSLGGVPEQIGDGDESYWELQKFLVLALKANPTTLECLSTPLVETASPLAEELRAMRGAFLSRRVYQTFNGYAMSQFRKLEADLRTRGAIRWKHAMHLIRLLLAGIATVRDGTLAIDAGEHRTRLLAIKHGEVAWAEINEWRHRLHAEFASAAETTRLPAEPDEAQIDAFLIRARRSMV